MPVRQTVPGADGSKTPSRRIEGLQLPITPVSAPATTVLPFDDDYHASEDDSDDYGFGRLGGAVPAVGTTKTTVPPATTTTTEVPSTTTTTEYLRRLRLGHSQEA